MEDSYKVNSIDLMNRTIEVTFCVSGTEYTEVFTTSPSMTFTAMTKKFDQELLDMQSMEKTFAAIKGKTFLQSAHSDNPVTPVEEPEPIPE